MLQLLQPRPQRGEFRLLAPLGLRQAFMCAAPGQSVLRDLGFQLGLQGLPLRHFGTCPGVCPETIDRFMARTVIGVLQPRPTRLELLLGRRRTGVQLSKLFFGFSGENAVVGL